MTLWLRGSTSSFENETLPIGFVNGPFSHFSVSLPSFLHQRTIMWNSLGRFILKYRILLLVLLLGATAFMAYKAKELQLSYEFANAIPTDHPKYKAYQEFRKKFGEDGNLLVIGLQTEKFFEEKIFNDYTHLVKDIKKVNGVEDIISITTAVNLIKDSATEKLGPEPIFEDKVLSQAEIDSSRNVLFSLPFYRGLLFNPDSSAWLLGVHINRAILVSKAREKTVAEIISLTDGFSRKYSLDTHLSGLPLIRTVLAKRIADEMQWFLVISVVLSAVILLLFFRSVFSFG